MLEFIKNQLNKLNIDLVSCLSLDECEITRPYLLEKRGITNGSVVIFAVPYLSEHSTEKRNISAYAVSRDYHIFFKNLFEDFIANLTKAYPEYIFAGFSDHSPINEVRAAAQAGLGVLGKNHLLITEKYSSFVFIGEIITNAPLPSLATSVSSCIGCNKCVSACPVNADINACLSAITQKKGELTDKEVEMMLENGSIWGCDVCQNVYPYTRKADFTPISFFDEGVITELDTATLDSMTDEEFMSRPFSWRGRSVIRRNTLIYDKNKK